jgi:hypothetical protein
MGRPRKNADILNTFRAHRTLAIDQLCQRLDCSRSTVLRRLNEHGYYSSYSHCGRFLTIEEAADFDSQGLWVWKTARFSRYHTLKKTAEHFVHSSPHGMTHEEIAALLGVRVHNTLRELVQSRRLHRQRIGALFVYLSCAVSVRRAQVDRRIAYVEERRRVRPTSRQIIATLLELIKDSDAERREIVLRCQHTGVSISRPVIDAIFETFDLDKKRGP